jgi:hypothetical protein
MRGEDYDNLRRHENLFIFSAASDMKGSLRLLKEKKTSEEYSISHINTSSE